jgi:hypothetical protein
MAYARQMFNLGGTAVTALTQMNAGTTATVNPFFAPTDTQLLAIDLFISPQAASSLAQSGRFEMTQENWKPVNRMEFAFTGFGLATAPQVIGGNLEQIRYVIDQPVKTQWPIVGSVIYFFSPVTPNLVVQGYFA